jgi:hypothetical protein
VEKNRELILDISKMHAGLSAMTEALSDVITEERIKWLFKQ